MIENIKNVVRRTLNNAHWMDTQSRDAAIHKVHLQSIDTIIITVTAF